LKFALNYILLVFFAVSVPTLKGQTPFFKQHSLPEYAHDAVIQKIYQSKEGYLWLGTSAGLFRYDGSDYVQYTLNDSLPEQQVSAIFQDRNGIMWIGYNTGEIGQIKGLHLKLWQPEEGLPTVPITGFAESGTRQFWIATYGEGVYCLYENRLYNFNTDDGLLADDIYTIQPDQEGYLWLGTDGGINRCQFNADRKKIIESYSRTHGLPDDIVRSILMDEHGNAYIGMYDKGICRWNRSTKFFEHLTPDWPYGVVNEMEYFEGRELWIGTDNQSVIRYNIDKGSILPLQVNNALQRSKIYDLLKDQEGNIWVASNNYGLSSANRQFEFIHCQLNNIQALLEDRHEQLWAGTQEGLFLIKENKQRGYDIQQYYEKEKLNVVSMYEDGFGNIWAGTFGNGVWCFNPISKKTRHITEKDGLSNGSILSIDGVNNKVWLASLGGVTEITMDNDPLEGKDLVYRRFQQESGLGTNFIYKVFVDSKNRTWFGTDGKGISLLENGQISNFQYAECSTKDSVASNPIPLKAVYSITEDREGNIWLSTPEEGIFEFDGQCFRRLAVKEGIRDLTIAGMATDAKGNIIIAHDRGIDILDPTTDHLIYYDDEVGINQFEPNLNAFFTSKDGQIYIGGQKNIIVYTSLKEEIRIHPVTHVNTIFASLEAIDYYQQHDFTHDRNNLLFDYNGLWLTDPEIVKYRYKLEGFDYDWISSSDKQAIYSNLPAGEYTFKLMSTENDAFSNEPVFTYSFEVHRPFWLQWWFVLSALLLLASLARYIVRSRDRRLAWEASLQKEKIASQFETLKSQINPHFLFNSFNTLIAVIEEDPKSAVVYVEKLSDFYRTMMLYRDKEVIAIQEEVELVKNYSYLLEQRFGKNFQLDIDINGAPYYIAPLTLQMLVENAVKHNVISKLKPLKVYIHLEKDQYIIIENNIQKKIYPEKSTKFGLQSISKRYELLSTIGVKVEEGKDTFKVSIPVIK